MNNHIARVGNITSSEIVALTKGGARPMTEEELAAYKIDNPKGRKTTIETIFGKAALSYIAECNMERRLGRSISSDSNAKPLIWGKFMESRVFKMLGIDHSGKFEEPVRHPTIPCWTGSVDTIKHDEGKTATDIKCPWTLKSFCTMAECKTIEELRERHDDGDKYYWQIVSNAIINDCKHGELIFYVPYKSELALIKQAVNDFDDVGTTGLTQNKLAFINFAADDELPWIPDGGYYKNLNVIRFDITPADVQALTQRVLLAQTMLIVPVG